MMKGWEGEGNQIRGKMRSIFTARDKISGYQVLVEYCMSGTKSQTQREEPAVVIERVTLDKSITGV